MSDKRNYEVNMQKTQPPHFGWCGYRFLLIISVTTCIIIYTAGAIVTGVVYKEWNRRANCTVVEWDGDNPISMDEIFDYNTPLVVIGPAFMAVGGAILAFLIFQWVCCRPANNR